MIEKFGPLYDKTFRRVGPLHRLTRAIVWKGGDASVKILSTLRQFELPPDRLLPLYKLGMLIGTYESETVQVCKPLIHTGMTVIDIGAHAGYYTFLFSRLVGTTGRVYAFEPHPKNFEILKRNVERHHLTNVTLIQKAVSDKNCNAIFHETALSMGHSLLPVKSYSNKISVETVSLSYFLKEQGVREVGLIKMDVEGGEPEVLEGISGLLKDAHDLSIIMEFKPSILLKRNYEPTELLKKLFAMDFESFVIKNDGKLIRVQPDDAARIISSIEKCNLLVQKSGKVLPT